MKKSGASQGQSASELISKRITELGDWRGETLSRMRKLIKEADPDVVEEWKWMGTPVFSHDGIICTGESYKKVVKLTFAKGAALIDPAGLFNSSLDGNVRRAIDIPEGEKIDEAAFTALIRQAVALNSAGKSKTAKSGKSKASKPTKPGSAKSAKSSAAKSAKSSAAKSSAAKSSAAKSAKSGAAKPSKPTKPGSAKSAETSAAMPAKPSKKAKP
jgi:hypothetical protein